MRTFLQISAQGKYKHFHKRRCNIFRPTFKKIVYINTNKPTTQVLVTHNISGLKKTRAKSIWMWPNRTATTDVYVNLFSVKRSDVTR